MPFMTETHWGVMISSYDGKFGGLFLSRSKFSEFKLQTIVCDVGESHETRWKPCKNIEEGYYQVFKSISSIGLPNKQAYRI